MTGVAGVASVTDENLASFSGLLSAQPIRVSREFYAITLARRGGGRPHTQGIKAKDASRMAFTEMDRAQSGKLV
jgi:hypothetical protein